MEKTSFFKKHADTAVILTAVLSSIVWMNGKFNHIDEKISSLDKEIAIVKTVLILKNVMPAELATIHDNNET